MKIVRVVNVELESNKYVTISSVQYYLWKLLYKTGSGLRVDRIMSSNYVYACEFCTRLWKKPLELIDDLEYVYMLGIVMLLDGTQISMGFMEPVWSVKSANEWKRVKM